MPIANARMYFGSTRAKHVWQRLLRGVLDDVQAPWVAIDDSPEPLDTLWACGDPGLAIICGLPHALRTPAAQVIAAPIPGPARFEGFARCYTDVVVRADSPVRCLEDTFSGIAAYTLVDSMAGLVAFNAHLRAFRAGARPRLYARSVGNLVNARGVVDPFALSDVDVGPLDSYYHDVPRLPPRAAAPGRSGVRSAGADDSIHALDTDPTIFLHNQPHACAIGSPEGIAAARRATLGTEVRMRVAAAQGLRISGHQRVRVAGAIRPPIFTSNRGAPT